jgi:hypothetical protein
MRKIQRLSPIVGVIAALAVAACGSDTSTGPALGAAAAVARHIDSLLLATLDSTRISSASYQNREVFLEYAEVGPAYGASPVHITVETAAGAQDWLASAWETVDSTGGVASGPYIVIVAYKDLSFTTAFVVYLLPTADTTYTYAALLAGDTIIVQAAPTSESVALTGLYAPCQLAFGLTDQDLAVQSPLACRIASFTGSVAVTFPAAPGVDASLLKFSIPSQTILGVRFATAPF